MAALTRNAAGKLCQDGQTAQQWLDALFEFELCPECGQDADRHEISLDALGLFRADCLDPFPDDSL